MKDLDISQYTSSKPKTSQAPTSPSPAAKSEQKPQVKQASSEQAHDFEDQYHKELSQYRVSPSASFYLRTYMLLPSVVKASGPMHIITKGDVLKYVIDNKV